MITKFNEFLNEKFDYKEHNPLEGEFGISINGDDIVGDVKDLVEFTSKNYKYENIDVEPLLKKGLFTDYKNPKNNDGGKVNIDDKWIEYKDLTPEQKKEYEDMTEEMILKSDLRYPIVVIKNKKGEIYGTLDGNHRLEKSHILKKPTIKAYVIPEEDILKKFKKK